MEKIRIFQEINTLFKYKITIAEKLSLTLFLIATLFLQSYLLRFEILSMPANLLEILIGIGFILNLIGSGIKTNLIETVKKIIHMRIIKLFSVLIIFSGINFLIREMDIHIFLRNIKFILAALAYVSMFETLLSKEHEKKTVLDIMAFGAVLFGIFSLFYNLLGYNTQWDNRLTGPLDSAVYLAFYIAPFFLYFSIQTLLHKNNKLLTVSALLSGLLLLATKSFGAIIACFTVLIVFLITKHSHVILKNKKVLSIILIGGLFVIGGVLYGKILPTIHTKYSSLDERGQIWQTAVYMLKEPKTAMFGVGLGQFEQNYIKNVRTVLNGGEPLDYYVIQPHNIFLLFWFNFGIPGLLFMLWTLTLLIKKILSLRKTGISDLQALACFALLYFYLHGLIDTPIFKNDLLIIFILLLHLSLFSKTAKSQIFYKNLI